MNEAMWKSGNVAQHTIAHNFRQHLHCSLRMEGAVKAVVRGSLWIIGEN